MIRRYKVRKRVPYSRAGKFQSWDIHRGRKIFRVNKIRNPRTGKVHWVVYRSEWIAYVKACSRPDDLGLILGGEKVWGNVPKNEEITCGHCRKIQWLNG